jgi:CRP-like cAMP-binding protein
MEQKFSNNSLDLETLREFCKREGEAVTYHKGDQFEREGDPARWIAFVENGCFKYVNHGISDDKAQPKVKEHITWFSFEGEFVVDYPTFLYGRPSQTTIEAMIPSRVLRVTGEQMKQFFSQNIETMELRAVIAEHILFQFRSRYLDLHCTTARERYDLLMQRCPGIVEHLNLQDIASFLNVTPKTISKIRKEITFGKE